MLALYRSGRQADALAEYQNARRALVDELGLEPSGELQALERAILTHDAALEPPRRAARELPARRRVLSWRLVAVATLVLTLVAFGLAFAFRGGEPAPRLLEPNSVGFIDSESGRVTKSYPVGREPSSIVVADDSLWVANYRDQIVTRIDRATAQRIMIPVGGHPMGLAAHHGTVWVLTLERLLVPIRFDRAGNSGSLGRQLARLTAPARGVVPDEGGGSIISGGGFLWITVPLTTVIRVRPDEPERAEAILPDDGARAAIAYRTGEAWVAGYDNVFPIEAGTGTPGAGVRVGPVRSLAFGAGSLWVVGGGGLGDLGARRIGRALRRVDLHGRVVEATIKVGSHPIAVVSTGRSIWVASRSDRAIRRVDPAKNTVVETIPLGASPTALAADADGVWVAVG
jgi:DNA-binding beta-propeller fold protein YncE